MSQTTAPKHDAAHDAHHGVSHIASFRSLAIVFGSLVVLTGVTYVASLEMFNFGSKINMTVALAIATLKASLVVLYFMHLRYDKPFNSIVFVGCLIFVSLFIGLALMDKTAYDKSVNKEQAPGMKDIHTPDDFKHKTDVHN